MESGRTPRIAGSNGAKQRAAAGDTTHRERCNVINLGTLIYDQSGSYDGALPLMTVAGKSVSGASSPYSERALFSLPGS